MFLRGNSLPAGSRGEMTYNFEYLPRYFRFSKYVYRLFWGNEGICLLFTEARITYLFFTLRGRVNESE
jgi:hypothetical protein